MKKFLVVILFVAIVFVCIAFVFHALRAPFFGAGDLPTNLLPMVHYKDSILNQGIAPIYTTLWYGGRLQYQNPLWNFFYFPSTIIYLLFSLSFATKLIITAHFVLATFVGFLIAKDFVKNNFISFFSSFLFLTPLITAIYAGHLEKILAYPWVLLGLRASLTWEKEERKNGLLVGLSLGQIAVTGANYYVLYATLLFGLVAIQRLRKTSQETSLRNLVFNKFTGSILLSALPFIVVKIPSVWYIAGKFREPVGYSLTRIELIFQSLFLFPISKDIPGNQEGMALVGFPIFIIFLLRLFFKPKTKNAYLRDIRIPLYAASLIFILFTTGLANKWIPLFNTFRVTSRAMTFLGITVVVLALSYTKELISINQKWEFALVLLFGLSFLHLSYIWVNHYRPVGTRYWIEDSGANEVASFLKNHNAKSVWIAEDIFDTRLVALALNIQGIHLPNVYYGAMGQTISASGNYCSYSFDFLIAKNRKDPPEQIGLKTFAAPYRILAPVPAENLEAQETFQVGKTELNIYKVICD